MFNLLVSLLFFLVSSDLKAEWTKVADTGNLGKDNYILFVDFKVCEFLKNIFSGP